MSSDEKAILAAIRDNPGDDLPRLAYADRLEEQVAPEQLDRAEFIRVQCELARLDEVVGDLETEARRDRLQAR